MDAGRHCCLPIGNKREPQFAHERGSWSRGRANQPAPASKRNQSGSAAAAPHSGRMPEAGVAVSLPRACEPQRSIAVISDEADRNTRRRRRRTAVWSRIMDEAAGPLPDS